MQFRHEIKHEISRHDLLVLRHRLRAVMQSDTHAVHGRYEVRSLYFDSLDDRVLRQKLDGLKIHDKFRVRLYNLDPSTLRLERKVKVGGIGFKTSISLTSGQAQDLADGRGAWMAQSPNAAIRDAYKRMQREGLKPKVIVDFSREPFIYGPGNVRVTLDYGIRMSRCMDVLAPLEGSLPIEDDPCILEVKWDQYLPDVVRHAVQLDGRQHVAFSKYAASRMYD